MASEKIQPARMPERVTSSDIDGLHALLDEETIGHFAFFRDGTPMVLPNAFARDGDTLLLHGSTGSFWMRQLATGVPVTASIAALDGLVYARSGFESSMLYRSAILFGYCQRVTGPHLQPALDILIEKLLPGRVAELRKPTKKELAATLVLRMKIDEWSLKVGSGWPEDLDSDIAGDTWAGILPITSNYGEPSPAPDLKPGVGLAPSVAKLSGSPVRTLRPLPVPPG